MVIFVLFIIKKKNLRAVYVTVYVHEKQHTSIPVGILVKYLKGFLFERKKTVREILVILHLQLGSQCLEVLSLGLRLSDVWSQCCLHPINNQTSVSVLNHSLHNDSGTTVTYTPRHTERGRRFEHVNIYVNIYSRSPYRHECKHAHC